MDRLLTGDVISVNGKRAILVALGRGLSRAGFVVFEDMKTTKLITEIDYWHEQGYISFVSRKASNKRWAAEYRKLNRERIPV